MLIEVQGVCRSCGTAFIALTMNGELLSSCSACGNSPVSFRAIAGLVYVIKNVNQRGVKIGMTEKSIEQRLASLSSTGVPGKFEIVALFPSDRPRQDEKRVHEALLKKRLAKEHFEIEAIDAVLKCYRTLNKRRPIFGSPDLELEFDLRLEKSKAEMKLRLMGRPSG